MTLSRASRVTSAAALALLLGAISTSAARADEVYRWVDEAGRVVHGTQPPPDARELQRLTPEAERAANPALDSARRRVEQADRVRTEAAQERTTPIGGRTRAEWLRLARKYEARVESARSALDREREHGLPVAYSLYQKRRHERRLAKKQGALEEAERALDAFRDQARRQRVPRSWYLP